jgi:flagellar basal-body rod protein FlgF
MPLALNLQYTSAMDLLSAATAAGLRSRTEALELLANNIANAQTTGYKADRELYSNYQTGEAWDAHTNSLDSVGILPDIDNHWTDFGQGPLQVTGNSLDFALQGKGFFVVEAPGGDRLMTRDGHFRLSPKGQLETSDGYAVLGVRVENGERRAAPIVVDPRQPVEITRDGVIRQQANAVGQILLTDPAQPQVLPKRSGNYFALDSRYLEQPPRELEVQQGKLEGANFSPAEAAVRLVNVMRQFETLQRALQLGGEMSRRAVEEVARVS